MNERQFEPQKLSLPTEEEIDQTFELIQDKLEEPAIKLAKNQQVKLGYENALNILDGTMIESEIVNIKGVQASAIAVLAADYLKGECSQKVLLGVPLKGSPIKPSIN